ncbi:MAG: hypothetical protein NZ949_02025, partial [Candidatus Kapabacteria bacterium]|nr:hypothetical protein [Candidatus Kapabacteria bacterium]
VGGVLSFGGYNGSDYVVRAAVRGIATQNWSTTAQGMALSFWTTPDGGTAEVERMRIFQNGNVGIGQLTTTPLHRLTITGGNLWTSYGWIGNVVPVHGTLGQAVIMPSALARRPWGDRRFTSGARSLGLEIQQTLLIT